MQKFYSIIENVFMKPMTKLSSQRHLMAIRDGMISTIPLTIVSSFFLIIAMPPVPETWKTTVGLFIFIQEHIGEILLPFRMGMGLIAIYATYNIGHSLAHSYKLDGVSGGTLALFAFFMAMIPPIAPDLGFVLVMSKLGGAGIFVGILTAIIAVEVLRFFKTKNLVMKMPDGVPESVSRAFANLFPAAAVAILMFCLTIVLKFDVHLFLGSIFTPLRSLIDTPAGAVILVLLITLLWTAGIHGVSIIGAVARPIWLEMLAINTDAVQAQAAGTPLPYITPEPFFQWFIWIGGSGGTLGLVILMLFICKSAYLKDLGKVCIAPALFNINEPVIFGLPIMLNPFFTIPFILGPVLATLLTYSVMAMNLVTRPYILAPWTFPAPIGAFLTTGGDWKAVILALFNIVLMAAIYFPFLKAYDKKMLQDERGEAK